MPARIQISISRQTLELIIAENVSLRYPVSTALAGVGEKEGSGCTPRGKHYIRACIGSNQPKGAVFVGRRPTGEVYSSELSEQFPERDWILTRILWLCGLEKGFNRGGKVDTQRRYIYIHGTPDTEPMGTPRSHGCIRMRNADLIELFSQVQPGTPVLIEE
ncbi:L,D-transpeptidase [Marinobacterium sediminicola]|uniref:L,D-transpeptidase catalytic domain n=1 Tax=Marinobacterium sediminicola TaxID=518898 RepID=A0ABY1RX78_9GAMM|nr:L,D-transpeptidase [Marinobacterium sediminicola]ULG67863.1 L,D-transpeptidase [Marinobacterium sediminicola]SMR71436.1 L,D-transpeptidase catalytic domain [Marinobacterium sediminicola]